MRTSWASLLVRSLSRISNPIPRSSVPPLDLQVRTLVFGNISFLPSFIAPGRHGSRWFSSEPALDLSGANHTLVADIFEKTTGFNDIEAELEAANVQLDHGTMNSVLRGLQENPEIARRMFDWLSKNKDQILSSKSYNLMLGIVGSKGESEEFWKLVEIMKNKGFGIEKYTYLKVLERFTRDGMEIDMNLLKQVYFLNSPENIVGRFSPKICNILREDGELEEIYTKLDDVGASLSSDLVTTVIERIGSEPKSALIFFRWVVEKDSFRVDDRVYNAMARVLGREDCIEEFHEILSQMRNGGFWMEKEIYINVSERFYKRKMIEEAVRLFEFANLGSEKPSIMDFKLLLRKILVSKDLDLDLVSRVVRSFLNAGNSIQGSVFDVVFKSLTSVGKLNECDKVLKAMEEGGFVADVAVNDRVIIGLCNASRLNEAVDLVDERIKLGLAPNLKTWASLVQKLSLAGDVGKALSSFNKMVEIKGSENLGGIVETLVIGLCRRNTVLDAFKNLKEMVTKKNLQPSHSTYKYLIERLVNEGNVKEASSLLELMKKDSFPPFIHPFIGYFSKSGSADDVTSFLKAMTVNEFPSRAVFLRLFEALLKAGRHEVAQDLLSKSPGSVRNHVDVLDLFYLMKPEEPISVAAV